MMPDAQTNIAAREAQYRAIHAALKTRSQKGEQTMQPFFRPETYQDGLRQMWRHILSTTPIPKRMVEVGVAFGESAAVHAEMNPDMELYLIDPWQSFQYRERHIGGDEMYQEVAAHFGGNHRVHLLRGTGEKWVHGFSDESLDFVYIDADHNPEPFRQDVNMWLPKVKTGAWIGGHDYEEFFQGLKDHVDNLSRLSESEVKVFADHSWLMEKTKNVVLAQHKDAQ